MPEEQSETEKSVPPVNPIDATIATRSVTTYLESIYGNLNLLMFRIEDVKQNGEKTKYLVLCSLLTNVGGPRRYYFVRVNITNGALLKISQGLRNPESGKIDWKEENLPEE